MPLSNHMFRNNPPPSIEFRVPLDKMVIHSPCILKLGHSNNPKDPHTKTQTCQ